MIDDPVTSIQEHPNMLRRGFILGAGASLVYSLLLVGGLLTGVIPEGYAAQGLAVPVAAIGVGIVIAAGLLVVGGER